MGIETTNFYHHFVSDHCYDDNDADDDYINDENGFNDADDDVNDKF